MFAADASTTKDVKSIIAHSSSPFSREQTLEADQILKLLPDQAVPVSRDDVSLLQVEKKRSQRRKGWPVREPSVFEVHIAELNGTEDEVIIKQFGYDLFEAPPLTFAPVDTVSVGPDYMLGPGDELNISLWGMINAQYSISIERDGSIALPQLGTLHLSLLTFSEAREFLKKELARYYKPGEVKINMSMGRLRSMRVFIVGKAQSPGSYTISSLSTLINALFAAGGPAKVGSMRDIQVKRNGEMITHFDLYDLLLKGDKRSDVRLMSEDVVFIPPSGPLVAISGNVRIPAIYELKGETTLAQLIEMAGGWNDIAFKGRVQIERIVDDNRRTIFEASLEDVETKDIEIHSGDLIRVFSIVPDKRIVSLSGPVHREGEFGFTPGMKVSDLISMAGGLKYYAYTRESELSRVMVTEDGPKTKKFLLDLEKAVDGDLDHDIPLQEEDYLFIRTIPEWEIYRTMTIEGEVRFPGRYAIEKGREAFLPYRNVPAVLRMTRI